MTSWGSKRKNKYRAIKTEVDGIIFDSKREAKRYQDLKLRVLAGEISGLILQPAYRIDINGQFVCTVKLDFEYHCHKEGRRVTEDSKGMDTAISRLKRKLLKASYGVEVQLV